MSESCFNCRGTPNRNLDSDKVYCWKKQEWVSEFKGCEEYIRDSASLQSSEETQEDTA